MFNRQTSIDEAKQIEIAASPKQTMFATWRSTEKNFLKKNEHLVRRVVPQMANSSMSSGQANEATILKRDFMTPKHALKLYFKKETHTNILWSPKFSKKFVPNHLLERFTSEMASLQNTGSLQDSKIVDKNNPRARRLIVTPLDITMIRQQTEASEVDTSRSAVSHGLLNRSGSNPQVSFRNDFVSNIQVSAAKNRLKKIVTNTSELKPSTKDCLRTANSLSDVSVLSNSKTDANTLQKLQMPILYNKPAEFNRLQSGNPLGPKETPRPEKSSRSNVFACRPKVKPHIEFKNAGEQQLEQKLQALDKVERAEEAKRHAQLLQNTSEHAQRCREDTLRKVNSLNTRANHNLVSSGQEDAEAMRQVSRVSHKPKIALWLDKADPNVLLGSFRKTGLRKVLNVALKLKSDKSFRRFAKSKVRDPDGTQQASGLNVQEVVQQVLRKLEKEKEAAILQKSTLQHVTPADRSPNATMVESVFPSEQVRGFLRAVTADDRLAVYKELTYHPSLVNCRDLRGNTPLHYAAKHGLEEMFAYLLAKGADPNISNNAGRLPDSVLRGDTVQMYFGRPQF